MYSASGLIKSTLSLERRPQYGKGRYAPFPVRVRQLAEVHPLHLQTEHSRQLLRSDQAPHHVLTLLTLMKISEWIQEEETTKSDLDVLLIFELASFVVVVVGDALVLMLGVLSEQPRPA